MPSTRRLSNASKEAFTEFCNKNQPLSRRLSRTFDETSINSVHHRKSITKDRGKHVLQRRNQSRNRTKEDTDITSVRKDLTNSSSPRIKRRRTSRTKSQTIDKENDVVDNNDVECQIMSPIPYWKVAEERGWKFSPRKTRSSARKKKLHRTDGTSSFDQATEGKNGLLIFSPPNHVENARREKKEQEKKMQERIDRIEENRKNGMLLVFSGSMESMNNQSPRKNCSNSSKIVKHRPRKEAHERSSEDNKKDVMPDILINDTILAKGIDEFSRQTKSTNHGENSQEMVNVIKGSDAKFQSLDRRLSEFNVSQLSAQTPPKVTMEELGQKTIQVEELKQTKCRLEKKNEELRFEVTRLESEILVERKKLTDIGAEFNRLKLLNNSSKHDINKYKDRNSHINDKILPKSEMDQEQEQIMAQTSSRLLEYETKVMKLESENKRLLTEVQKERAHFMKLNEDSHRAQQEQQLQNEKREKHTEEIQQSLFLTQRELHNERSRSNENMIEFRRVMERIENMMEEKEIFEKEISKLKNEIVSKNKEHYDAVGLAEEEKKLLENNLQHAENQLKSVSGEKNNALIRLATSGQRENELFNSLRQSDLVRKELHARVMVLLGNIRVFVRVRPPLSDELEGINCPSGDQLFKFSSGSGNLNGKKSSKYGCDDPTKNIIEIKEPCKDRGGLNERRKKWTFGFDNVFDPSHSQEDVWEAIEPLIQCAIDGFNVTVFAYGQTGSGKTFTMMGDQESPVHEGIIFRSIRKLFDAKARIEELSQGEQTITMTVELLEVYNEEVRDLLSPKEVKTLKISGNRAVGSIKMPVDSKVDVLNTLKRAHQRRKVKSTLSNATSSRSHFLFTIEYTIASKNGTKQVGKLNICDLAGSERLSKSGTHIVGGSLLKETKHINLSLSFLSNVIARLQAGDKNVPFRDSKLTTLLRDSLVGNSKTLCIVCCNPLHAHLHETLCSLRFAAKINKVDLKSVQNFSA